MPSVGVEPTRCCHHWILSPARLPIPPQRHVFLCCFFVSNNYIRIPRINRFVNPFFQIQWLIFLDRDQKRDRRALTRYLIGLKYGNR